MRRTPAFTLIELILYVAILAIVLGGLTQLAWTVVGAGNKSATQEEISAQARYVSARITSEIRNANGINTGSSTFDTNLALAPAAQLSLAATAPNDPTLISVAAGKVRLKQGAAAAINLNSDRTTVQDLTFSNYTSLDNKTKNITYTLTLSTTSGSGRYEYSETISLRGDAEIRSN